MDTERWQILLKAIDRGSLRAAADEMGFTVSGISRSVATLEKELGFALLYRAKSGVQPTAECRQLLPSVRELLFAQERLEQTAAKVRGADCGTIVIGTAYNCYYEWVTQMMAAFRTRHPGVVIKIVKVPAASWPRCCWITARISASSATVTRCRSGCLSAKTS